MGAARTRDAVLDSTAPKFCLSARAALDQLLVLFCWHRLCRTLGEGSLFSRRVLDGPTHQQHPPTRYLLRFLLSFLHPLSFPLPLQAFPQCVFDHWEAMSSDPTQVRMRPHTVLPPCARVWACGL